MIPFLTRNYSFDSFRLSGCFNKWQPRKKEGTMKIKYAISMLAFLLIFTVSMTSPVFSQEQAEPQGAPAFSISKMVIAGDVQDREPIGVAEVFPASTERVYCFIEATDIVENTEATVVWYHEGNEMRTFTLSLTEGPRWKTFAYKNLYGQTGNWMVEVKDKAGNSVRSIAFKVE